MWRWYTAEDRRQAAALVLVLMVCGACVVASGPVLVGTALLARRHLTGSRSPDLTGWPSVSWRLLGTPSDPGAAFDQPGALGNGFWLLSVLTVLALASAYGWFGVQAYRLVAPLGSGFAGRADLARDLSVLACRRRATVTRPDLSRKERRRIGAGRVGIPLHEAPVSRARLWLPLENATGVIAPQQSGKTLMDLIHKVLDAPSGLIVTSTKLDLFLLTARARERGGSPVQVLDLTGAVNWSARVRWDPVRDCTALKTAKRRARALLRATAGEGSDGAGNHAFFERRAVDVMTAYLLAAGLSGASLAAFVGWCQNDLDTEAADVLRDFPDFIAVRRTLQQAQSVVEETRSGIWETLRDAIACLTDPEVVASALPVGIGTGFDPARFVLDGGTVYVLGSETDAAAQAPLITAFVQEVLDTARRLAIAGSSLDGRERLSPPFTAVLDEIASICPLPDLPATLSDSAGRGVLVHYALQSPAQAQARWGKDAATLFDNTTALTIFGGLKSEETLKWASLLTGRRLEERRSRQSGRTFADPESQNIGTERVDVLEPAAIRLIPRGRGLLIMRSMPALIVRLRPAWKRPDWRVMLNDAAELRRADTPVSAPHGVGSRSLDRTTSGAR